MYALRLASSHSPFKANEPEFLFLEIVAARLAAPSDELSYGQRRHDFYEM